MPPRPIPFVGPTYQSQSPAVDNERCINWYVEQPEGMPKAPAVLYPTPGYQLFATLPLPIVRGLYTEPYTGRVFAVAGSGLYEIASTGVVTLFGAVTDDGKPAQFASGGVVGGQMMVTAGGHGYIVTLSTNVVTGVLSGTADFCGFIDGYFVALDVSTSTLYVSALNDGLTWPALSVARRSVAADPWVSMVVADRKIHLFGSHTSESWYNSGDPDFPFAHAEGSLVRDGCAAPYSTVALVDNSRIWLTQNEEGVGIIKRSSGYETVRISTEAVEYAIQGYAQTSDALAWSYQDQGHTFYVLLFPTERATWVYDAKTNLWHERGWWDTELMEWNAIRGRCHCYGHGKHLVGDRIGGGVYEQSIDFYNEIGGKGAISATVKLRRLRQGPHLHNNGAWMYFPEIRLDVQTGLGQVIQTVGGTVQMTDPQIMLQYSDDGGRTWSNERWVSAGGTGAYGTQAVWRRCGRSQDRVFRVVVTDGVPWRLIGLSAGV